MEHSWNEDIRRCGDAQSGAWLALCMEWGGVSYFGRLSLPFEVFLARPICNNLMICLCWPRLST